MNIIDIEKMQQLQTLLWEKNKFHWPQLEPCQARNSLLWMIEEMGEVISILKKRGEADIMSDIQLREIFIEEMSDVLMFFNDVLIAFKISPTEFSDIYLKKHQKNMNRDFLQDDSEYLRSNNK